MKDEITLSDGTTVSWDAFSQLSDAEQARLTKQTGTSGGAGYHMPQRELLPRIRSAVERNRITEEDLLTFIKIMHDTFFPPAPIEGTGSGVIRRKVQRSYGGAFVKQSKRVMTEAGEFPSMAAAARAYQVDGARVRAWIRQGKAGFYFI